MSVNNLINNALSSGGKVITGGLVFVEGHAETNALHINDIDSACKQNMTDFVQGQSRGWVVMGVFKTREEASEFCTLLRSYIKDEEGKILV